MKEQEELVKDIENGVDNLGNIAIQMNKTSKEQGELLKDLDNGVEESNSRVKIVTDLTKKMIEKSGGECRCAIIVFLVVAIFILLLVMVFA
jgi:t-SNARE complex subunit (syntaxin)